MIPGLNTNVSHAGVAYHVQTEDLGLRTSSVLTLVFRQGAILAREKISYRQALGAGATEAQIKHFMEERHHRIVQALSAGQPPEIATSQAAATPPVEPIVSPTEPDQPQTDEDLDRLIAEYVRTRRAAKPR